MKLRASFAGTSIAAPVGLLAVLPIPLVEPGLGYGDAAFWAIAAAACAAVVLIGAAARPIGILKVDGPRLYMRGKYGWNLKHELAEGERLDFADGRLRVRLADGTFDGPVYAVRWMVARRDWDRLEAAHRD
ncbi:hypothetical protein [Glycomyces paridis]|uniref:Uncharacterized protein n=1 Tax=Glycomyces paridis TaxID=2126555 RepID=A0A4S8P9X9_9ACTN|nr:hypothetical protein [Glycomyces paridis]THV27083.1 hypothetical protein E9998_16575 [Glycomyces paridis]